MQKPRHKFNARPSFSAGKRYDSKLEAKCAGWLDALKVQGEVLFYLRQVPFDLPGGVKYRCDFQVFWASGEVSFVDAKGMETDTFKLKKKQVEDLYPVTIELWKGLRCQKST